MTLVVESAVEARLAKLVAGDEPTFCVTKSMPGVRRPPNQHRYGSNSQLIDFVASATRPSG